MENNYHLHYRYAILILVLILICLITVRFGNIEKVVDYISFALTITSLFLSLISIIYAFYSSSSSERNLANIDKATLDLDKSAVKLGNVIDELDHKLGVIPDSLKSLESKIDISQQFMQELYQDKSEGVQQDAIIPEELVSLFTRQTSIAGLLIIYAALLSFEKNKWFSITTFAENVDMTE